MAFLVPLLEWLIPLIAAAIIALSTPLASAIVNLVTLGNNWLTKAVNFLVDKAIHLAVDFANFMAPYFIQAKNRQINFFHQLGQLAHYGAHFAHRTAVTMLNFNTWLLGVHIPYIQKATAGHAGDVAGVKVRTQPFTKAQLATIEATMEAQAVRQIEAALPGIIARPFPQINWDASKWRKWLFPGAIAGGLTIPGATGGSGTLGKSGTGAGVVPKAAPGTWEADYEKTQNKINSRVNTRLRKMNWLLAFTGAGALVFAGLAKLGLQWLKCPNVGKLGRFICHIPHGLFDELLGLIADVLILTDWCAVLPAISAGFDEIEGPLTQMIDAAGDALCAGKYAAPPKMVVAATGEWLPAQIAA